MVHTPEGADALRHMHKAQVIVSAKGPAWENNGEPIPPQIVFDGYVTGLGYARSQSQVEFRVGLLHWLSDLHFSSSLSNQSHPGNPARFRWAACFNLQQLQSQTVASHFVSDTTATEFFQPVKLTKDFWSRSLHQFFCALSKVDLLEPGSGQCWGAAGAGGAHPANEAALGALQRIECNLGLLPGNPQESIPATLFDAPPDAGAVVEFVGDIPEIGAKSKYHVPLALRTSEGMDEVSRAIATWCRSQSLDSYARTTLWDQLVGSLAPQFKFAVIPKVHTAQIVPVVAALREVYTTLSDISSFSMRNQVIRPLRAVGVTASTVMYASMSNKSEPAWRSLGGCYSAPGVTKGMTRFINPPAWLSQVPASRETAVRAISSANVLPTAQNRDKAIKSDSPTAVQTYLDRYARSKYIEEALRGRWAAVQSRARFDIAPGSTVLIPGVRDMHLPDDASSEDIIGRVVQVQGSISAQGKQAGTQFQLDHLRTRKENEADATSSAEHPLYTEVFAGAPLLQAFAQE